MNNNEGQAYTDSKTNLFSVETFQESHVKSVIKDVYNALKEKGYNPTSQLIGYIMSGDPGYISSHNDARSKITSIDRSRLLEILISDYLSRLWNT